MIQSCLVVKLENGLPSSKKTAKVPGYKTTSAINKTSFQKSLSVSLSISKLSQQTVIKSANPTIIELFLSHKKYHTSRSMTRNPRACQHQNKPSFIYSNPGPFETKLTQKSTTKDLYAADLHSSEA